MTTTHTSTAGTRKMRRAGAAMVIAVLLAACGGSDSEETEDSVPAADSTPVADEVVEPEPVATDPPPTDPPVETTAPVEVPTLPCASYVEETGYPLVACDSGVLTETLQRDLVKVYPDVFIDGLFGQQTFDFVKQFQADNGLEETGIVSEQLATTISGASADATPTTDAPADEPAGDDEAGEDDE